MDRSIERTEWKPEATVGKHTQVGLALIGEVPRLVLMEIAIVQRSTFTGCLNEAARNSGMEDQELAEKIHISAGYMSRFIRGVGQQWAKRLVAFMRVTNSLAPLQWIADQMGCDVVSRADKEARIRDLEYQLLEAKRAA